jgi:prohibitin 1
VPCSPDDSDQLLKNREQISQEIKKNLTQKASAFGLILEDVSIMQLSFSKEYAQAIEQKAVQQQLAERQRFVVYKDEHIKNAQIIASEAEAESAKLMNVAVEKYGNTQVEIKRMEASRYIAEVLAKNPRISFLPEQSNLLYNLKI